MNRDVKSQQLDEGRVLAEAEESGQVPRVILVGIDCRKLTLTIDITVDTASDVGQLGNPGVRVL